MTPKAPQKAGPVVVLGYGEIGIKKKNRPFFTNVLKRNLLRALDGLPCGAIEVETSRLLLYMREPLDAPTRAEVCRRLRFVPGVAHFAVADRLVSREIEALEAEVDRVVGEALNDRNTAPRTFCIETARGDKRYPMTSPDLNARLGRRVQERTGLQVDLERPDLRVHVLVLQHHGIVHTHRIEGERGLPVGSAGRVVSLLSSGIDSPVAAYRMMRRGCRVYFVHFHSRPFTSRASVDLARELARQLAVFQNVTYLYEVPLGEIQQRIVTAAPSPLRILLYRRFMVRLAECVARKVRGRALVTGESVAQVASQTLENIAAIDAAAGLPILRPLIGMDKEEIIRAARRLGTYETSSQPYEDCCAFLMPQHPETHAQLRDVDRAESLLGDLEPMLRDALARARERKFRSEGGRVLEVARRT